MSSRDTDGIVDPLEQARRGLGLSVSDLWWRYFAVGGMSSELEVEAFLYRALVPTDAEHDMLAVALNERCRELGGDHPLPYTDDGPRPQVAHVAEDSERQRIARRTNDEVTSRLIGVGLQLQDAWRKVDEHNRIRLADAMELLDAAIAALPNAIFPEDLGPSATVDE